MAEFGIEAAGVIAGKVGEEIYNQVQRTVTVKIKNDIEDKLLNNPEIITRRGKIYTPPEDVHPNTEETLLFHKTPLSPFGAIGAFIYTIGDTQNRAVVFYANPFFGKNRFGLRWISTSDEFDLQSWISEYRRNRKRKDYLKDIWIVGDKLSNKEKECSDGYVVKAFMTHGGHATLSVTLTKKAKSSEFNKNHTPDTNTNVHLSTMAPPSNLYLRVDLHRTKSHKIHKSKRSRQITCKRNASSMAILTRKRSATEGPDFEHDTDESDIISNKKMCLESSRSEAANEKELKSDVETDCDIDDDKFWESKEIWEISIHEAS